MNPPLAFLAGFLGAGLLLLGANGLVSSTRRRNPSGATWRDFIRGEWWLLPDGTSEFADRDTGENAGHAALAEDAMLDFGEMVEIMRRSAITDEQTIDFIESSGDYTPSNLLAEYGRGFTSERLALAVKETPVRSHLGKRALAMAIVGEPERVYMEYWGAIRVAGRSFQLYRLTEKSIRAMQDFLLEQFAEGVDVAPDKSKIEIEDMQGNYIELPIEEFLTLKYPREIFGGQS